MRARTRLQPVSLKSTESYARRVSDLMRGSVVGILHGPGSISFQFQFVLSEYKGAVEAGHSRLPCVPFTVGGGASQGPWLHQRPSLQVLEVAIN
jgi:hypothetical protein